MSALTGFRIDAFLGHAQIGSSRTPDLDRAEQIILRYFQPDGSRLRQLAEWMDRPETTPLRPRLYGRDVGTAAEAVDVSLNGHHLTTLLPEDMPDIAQAPQETWPSALLAPHIARVAALPPLPRGARKREVLEILTSALTDPERALALLGQLRPHLK